MNSRRVVAGAIGLGAALAFASVVPESGIPGARLLAFVLTFLVVGTLDQFLSGRHTAEKVPLDTRAADGRAELAEVAGVRSEPNPIDARFGRFVGFESAARVAARDQEKKYPSTCPPLLGRVVIASWFLGRDGRGWSADDAARSMATLLRVATWVEREAIRWGAAVNLEIARVYLLARDDRDDPVEVGFAYEGGALAGFDERETEKTIAGLNRAAVGFGFGHAGEMLRAFNTGIEADAVAWLLHPRRAGRSFALPGRHDWPGGVGLAVCYPELSERPEPMHGPVSADPATVAHELLHLFGASDKYHQPLAAFRKGTVSRREVMRLGDERLSRLRVDRQTAVEIGWISG